MPSVPHTVKFPVFMVVKIDHGNEEHVVEVFVTRKEAEAFRSRAEDVDPNDDFQVEEGEVHWTVWREG